MEITGVDDFKGRLKAAMNEGMHKDEALVFLQMKQRERHHIALRKILENVSLHTYILTGDQGHLVGYREMVDLSHPDQVD